MKGKAKIPQFTHEQLLRALSYNPATGVFTWKISPAKNVRAGAIAGSRNDSRGYRYVRVCGEEVTTARLAWFYMKGEWPDRRIRFVNGDPRDERFENLTLFSGVAGEFDHRSREGRQAYQNAYRKLKPHIEKGRALRESFGLSLEEYQMMHDAQSGRCAICDSPESEARNGKVKMLAVDHCHKTGKIRGLLCSPCNQGIGKLKEDRNILLKAVEYLDKHSQTEGPLHEHPTTQ
jgi:hypothetical protein